MIAAGGLAAALAAPWTGCAAPAPAAPGPWLELDVPAFRLDACADTALLRSFPVAVGTRKYPAPLGDFHIAEVVWNPWWRPPEEESLGHAASHGCVRLATGT